MTVKELKEVVDYDQRVIIEDEGVVFVDTSKYDSDICSDDDIKRVYIDKEGTIHIVVK